MLNSKLFTVFTHAIFIFFFAKLTKSEENMKTQKAVALRISSLLVKNHLSQYALCKRIAMPEETLRSIITERYNTVKMDTIILICDGFKITLQEFFNDELFKRENLEVE